MKNEFLFSIFSQSRTHLSRSLFKHFVYLISGSPMLCKQCTLDCKNSCRARGFVYVFFSPPSLALPRVQRKMQRWRDVRPSIIIRTRGEFQTRPMSTTCTRIKKTLLFLLLNQLNMFKKKIVIITIIVYRKTKSFFYIHTSILCALYTTHNVYTVKIRATERTITYVIFVLFNKMFTNIVTIKANRLYIFFITVKNIIIFYRLHLYH